MEVKERKISVGIGENCGGMILSFTNNTCF
jgi:hypothetical protein